jgi:hypothetical protein
LVPCLLQQYDVAAAGLQVLEQLQLLQDQVALTYSEARAAAKQQQEPQQQQEYGDGQDLQWDNQDSIAGSGQCMQDAPQLGSNHACETSRQFGSGSSSAGKTGAQYSSNGSSSNDKANDMLTAFLAELRGAADDEGAAAAAAAALTEMREWVAQQDMRMVEVRHNVAAGEAGLAAGSLECSRWPSSRALHAWDGMVPLGTAILYTID